MLSRQLLLPCLALLAATSLSACDPVSTAVGGVAAVGYVGLQDRPVKQTASDSELKVSLKRILANSDISYLTSIGVDVFYGDVLLTGMVPTQHDADVAVDLARRIENVRHVFNQLFVGTSYSAGTRAHDAWLSTHIQGVLLADGQVYPLNYIITTVNGHVYVLGSTSTAAEHDRVIQLISTIAGVVQVHDFLVLRGYHEAGEPDLPVNPLEHIAAPEAKTDPTHISSPSF